MGIDFQPTPVTLATLQGRLLERVRQQIQNGELTERGLARLCGFSQPHMHHILKGVRGLSVELADEMMLRLRIPLLELLKTDELPLPMERKQPHSEVQAVPVVAVLTPVKFMA